MMDRAFACREWMEEPAAPFEAAGRRPRRMLMRPVWGIGAAALLLAFAWNVQAQGTPDRATIKVQEAEVRSGHGAGPKFYATNRLRYGDPVEVTKTLDDGWLEIMPPRQSFSWINARMLEQVGTNVWMVKGERGQPVDVYYGSSVHEAKPDVRSTSVPAGSQVVSIAKAKTADDGMWLPIEPPPSERRYILAEALGRTNAASRPPVAPGEAAMAPLPDGQARATSKTGTQSDGLTPTQPAGSISALVTEAQKAEQARDYGSAIKSWEEVAKASENTNASMALNCRNHIQWLRNRIAYIEAGNAPMPRANDRIAPRPASGYGASNCYPAPAAPSYNGTSRSYSQATPADGNQDSQRPPKTAKRTGLLQQVSGSPNGKPAYRLVSSDQQTYVMVLPQQGVDLAQFVNRNVELEGTIEWHSEPRQTFIVNATVNPLR
jgi:hypothetical protein